MEGVKKGKVESGLKGGICSENLEVYSGEMMGVKQAMAMAIVRIYQRTKTGRETAVISDLDCLDAIFLSRYLDLLFHVSEMYDREDFI